MRKESVYQFNESVSFSRRLIAFFVAFLLLFASTLVCYSFVDYLVARSKSSASYRITQNARELQGELIELTADTRLAYKKDGGLSEISDMAENYVRSLCITSLGGEVEKETAYSGAHIVKNLSAETDGLFYYFGTYKPKNVSAYPASSAIGYDYAKNQILKDGVLRYFDVSLEYPLLSNEYAIALDGYLSSEREITKINETDYNGKEICNDILTVYAAAINSAREDFFSNNSVYNSAFDEFSGLRESLVGYKWLELTLTYLVITSLAYIAAPMLIKGRVSLIHKLLKTTAVDRKGYEVPFWSVLLKWLAEFITFFNTVFLVIVILYSRNSIAFLRYKLFGFLPFTAIYVFSVLIMIASMIACAADKKNHCTIADFMSGQLMKDLRN